MATDPDLAIKLYRANLSTVKTGAILGISPQRVRQILKREERKRNEKIIVPYKGRGGKLHSKCPVCGGKKSNTTQSFMCRKCFYATIPYNNRKHVDDEALESIANRKLAGESFNKLASEYGYSYYSGLEETLIGFLKRNNDPRLAQIYPNHLPKWYLNKGR